MSKPDLGGFPQAAVPGLYGPDMGGFPAARTWGTLTGPDMGGYPPSVPGPLEGKFTQATNPFGAAGMSASGSPMSALSYGANWWVIGGAVIGTNGPAVIRSNDNGHTWQKASDVSALSAVNPIRAIARSTCGVGNFVCFTGSSIQYGISADGDVWSAKVWVPSVAMDNVTEVGGSLIAFASAASASGFVSRDGGQNWTTVTMPSSQLWRRPAINPSGTIVVGSKTATATAISTDGGLTWVAGGALGAADSWEECVYGDFAAGGVFLIHSSINSTRLQVSFDAGVTWTLVAGLNNINRQSVVFWNNAFFTFGPSAVGTTIETSTDGGLTWSTSTTAMPTGGQFITRASQHGYCVGFEATNPITKLVYGALGSLLQ